MHFAQKCINSNLNQHFCFVEDVQIFILNFKNVQNYAVNASVSLRLCFSKRDGKMITTEGQEEIMQRKIR